MAKARTTVALVAWFAFTSALLFAHSVRKPYHNWDMIFYAASAKAFALGDVRKLHAFTYEELKKSVPQDTYADLTAGVYRETVSRDVEAFSQQLPFYRIRVLYNGAVFLVSLLGIHMFAATHLVSALGVAAGLWLILAAFRPYVAPILLVLFPFFAVPFGLVDVAKYSTPDGLAFAFVCLSMFLFLKSHRSILIVLPLGVLVRSDLIVFNGIVFAYLFVGVKRWRPWVAAAAVLSAAGYLWVNAHYGSYGLETTYYMTFIETLPYPERGEIHFGAAEYLAALKTGLGEAATNVAALQFVGACAVSGYVMRKRRAPRGLGFVLASSVIYVTVHFLLFPEVEERLFLGQYLLVLATLLSLLRSKPRGLPQR